MLKIIVLITPLVLASCIGSNFVVDDADTSASFPKLHDVPERPEKKTSSKACALKKEELAVSKKQELSDNEILRRKYKL